MEGSLTSAQTKEPVAKKAKPADRIRENEFFISEKGLSLFVLKSVGEFERFGKNAWRTGRKNFFRMISPR
tara:strand:- start:306 stop:515 length:210 start_codon:yes stop_codon:yes gene_type:complete